MLILEGPDCSGKTSLAQHIATKYDVPFEHLGLPPVGTRHQSVVRSALHANRLDTVYDRMMIGSVVFGRVKPDAHNQQPVTLRELERWCELINKLGATLVRCTAPTDKLVKRFHARGDEYIDEATLRASIEAYDNVFDFVRPLVENFILYRSDMYSASYAAEYFGDQIEETLVRRRTPNDEESRMIAYYMVPSL